jgi:hypothetical protein
VTDLVGTVARVTGALDRLGVGYCLVGGFAVSVRSEPRFTRDLDLAVAVADDAGAELVTRTLLGEGFSVDVTVEHDEVGRLATVRLVATDGDLVDLLFSSSGIEAELVAAAERLEVLPGLSMPVATIGHLIALKLLSRDDGSRPQDAGDLVALTGVAEADDLAAARTAVELIEGRGYARGRDLRASLEELEPRRP